MKRQFVLMVLWFVFVGGGTNAMAKELSVHGIKGGARIEKTLLEIVHVSLEEGDAGAAINLALRITGEGHDPEMLVLTAPATTRQGEVRWSQGVVALRRVEGLDENFYTSPENIVWRFDVLPLPVSVAGAAGTESATPGANEVLTGKARLYLVDGLAVTEREHAAFLKTLKGQEHWYCDETAGGGETGWEAKSPSGVWYKIVSESGGENISSISRMPNAKH